MAEQILPTFLYKIIPNAPPHPIPEEYPLSELDTQSGFVHLSEASQVSKQSVPVAVKPGTQPC
jgi:uncharacterized protein (DUF952 family)